MPKNIIYIRERCGIVLLIMELFFRTVEKTFLSLTSRAPTPTNNTKTGAMRKKTSHPYTKICLHKKNFLRSQSTTEATFWKKNERRVRDVLHLFRTRRLEYYVFIILRRSRFHITSKLISLFSIINAAPFCNNICYFICFDRWRYFICYGTPSIGRIKSFFFNGG